MYILTDGQLTQDNQSYYNVVSGFPGIGKSALVRANGIFLDSDSSTFDKTQFPQNYITHIKGAIEDNKVIFASCHEPVRDALVAEGISFILVYPDISLKDEYIERYKQRGSPEAFITFISNNWENFINALDAQTGCAKVKLASGEYLSDIIEA